MTAPDPVRHPSQIPAAERRGRDVSPLVPTASPAVQIDLAHSLIVVAGARFPATLVRFVDTPGEIALGGPSWPTSETGVAPFVTVYVPCENGALVEVDVHGDRVIHATLMTQRSRPETVDDGERPLHLLVLATINQGRIRQESPRRVGPGEWLWEACEPEWLAEHLARIGRLAVDGPLIGERVELLPLTAATRPWAKEDAPS